jgi:hypothetical protein
MKFLVSDRRAAARMTSLKGMSSVGHSMSRTTKFLSHETPLGVRAGTFVTSACLEFKKNPPSSALLHEREGCGGDGSLSDGTA